MYGELTAPPREGRPPLAEKSSRKSVPVTTVKGFPEDTSTIGARVKSLNSLRAQFESFDALAVWNTALFTQRWRWSKLELERSRFGKRLSCGSSKVCRSVESSISCDHV